jgi:hypothetical protein
VIARELARAQGKAGDVEAWVRSFDEAGALADAIREGWGDGPLSFGAREGEVNWPEFACLAARYAEAPPELRFEIREAFRKRQLSPVMGAVPLATGLCPREVLADKEYQGTPACYPREAVAPAAAIVGGILGGVFIGWIAIMVTSRG